jgi:hypothetical protein
MTSMPPAWAPIWLTCKACGHEWDDWQPCRCPIPTWVAHVKTYRCPICHKRGRNILIRMQPLEEGAPC